MWYDRAREDWERSNYEIAAHTNSKPLNWSTVTNIVLHYTADKHANADTAQYLANMQQSYVTHRGYSLGYSVAVDQRGTSWEIRGTDYTPAANIHHNNTTFVVLCLVDWQNPCNQLMVDTVRGIVRWARQQANRALPVIGHRDLAATQCPGDGIYSQIQQQQFEPVTPGGDGVNVISPPVRMFDSRTQGGKLRAGESRKVNVGKHKAVFVNVTVADPSGAGFVTAYADGPVPNVSNVNFQHGQNICNTSWVPVAKDGTISVHVSAACNIIVDMQATQD
jgi:hypothetical protein